MAETIAGIDKRLHVKLPPAAAFALFTRDLARWWPLASHSCGGADAVGASFDERIGGAVTEVTRDGHRHVWGTLLAWDPPHRFAMSWHPGNDPAQATRVEVRFAAAADGGTILHLRHDGWEARPDGDIACGRYDGGWDIVLGRFLALAGAAAP
jgi:uncharacterized protein YndB with AHSA1/START domain